MLDNTSTHKTPAIRRWLFRHPRFEFHFTPTSSSWMNLVERWFAEITNKWLRRGTHRSVKELATSITHWVGTWNDDPRPYVWHKTADEIFDSLAQYCQRISESAHYYIYGPDGLPLEQINITTGAVTWYHHDQLGSTRTLTNTNGTVVGTATYNPYGTTTATTGTTTPLGYTGAYCDPETGLIYLINRYYDPTTAQFLSIDPIESLTQAPYTHASDDPINNADPSGLSVSANYNSPSYKQIVAECTGPNPPSGCNGAPVAWRGTLQIVGAAAGVVALATGVGEIAAGAFGAYEGADAISSGWTPEPTVESVP